MASTLDQWENHGSTAHDLKENLSAMRYTQRFAYVQELPTHMLRVRLFGIRFSDSAQARDIREHESSIRLHDARELGRSDKHPYLFLGTSTYGLFWCFSVAHETAWQIQPTPIVHHHQNAVPTGKRHDGSTGDGTALWENRSLEEGDGLAFGVCVFEHTR